eukprot:c11508_g1_i2.p1 GENE.c11508_g1_i2~~c11508_g1_i2.p1  ORF type:complete len:687 (-),score=163.86 c11508_g1_i2:98-2158(-)
MEITTPILLNNATPVTVPATSTLPRRKHTIVEAHTESFLVFCLSKIFGVDAITLARIKAKQQKQDTNGKIQHEGIVSHAVTFTQLFLTFLFQNRMFAIASVVVLCLFFALRRKDIILPEKIGQIYVWSSIVECSITLAILLFQRFAKYSVTRGRPRAAKVMLVPSLETLLWIVFLLSLIDLFIMTQASPEFPHFLAVYFDSNGGRATITDHFDFFVHNLIKEFSTVWLVYFLFYENTLSRIALIRVSKYSAIASFVTALACVLSYAIFVAHQRPGEDNRYRWVLVVTNAFVRGLGFVAFAHLSWKAFRSSRRSVLPFAVVACVICILDVALCMATATSNDHVRKISSFSVCIATSVFLTTSLYWTLLIDTLYWRGVTRMPIWCVNSDISPYDQVPDAVIERDMPLLIDRPSLLFIDFAFLQFGPLIGSGATCCVYRGEVSIGALKGKAVAIKVFTPIEISSETLSEFANEIHKYERLRHVRVMQLVGVCVRPPDVCMVCELCESSLHTHIHSLPLNVHTKMKLSVQVCEAVMFIHTLCPPLIHRDIKSHNFLITSTGDCKLSDFGTSKEFHEHFTRDRSMTKSIGSMFWMSPEVLSGNKDYDLKADIFSLAIVLWEIWSQEDPYENVPGSSLASQIIAGLRPDIPELCPKQLCVLIESMWKSDPIERPNASEVLQFMNEISAQIIV